MAEEDEAAEEAAKKKKKMMIGGLIAAVLVYQFVLKGSEPVEAEAAAAEAAEVEEVLPEGEIAPIEELVVNLADTDQLRYLRVGVGAVLAEGTAAADVETQLAKVNDVVIDIVQTKTFDDLRQPGATAALKEEISASVRDAFPEGEVVRVIFTAFVMQ